jgi:hypothetical protein
MLEHADYNTLATLNRLVVDTCERVEHQKERILSLQRRCTAAKYLRLLRAS